MKSLHRRVLARNGREHDDSPLTAEPMLPFGGLRSYASSKIGMTAQEKGPDARRLQTLRNIGPKLAAKLLSLGIENPEQMMKADPEALYEELRERNAGKLDRCVLYSFRGAKYDIPWPRCLDPFTPPGGQA